MPAFLFHHATAGLLALLGLAVPVAIHLWNRRPGRTVRVGSVRWLEAAANRRLRNLRLEQVWLLLLRAALVALLALVVADPVWMRPRPAQVARGVVLLAPQLLRPDVLPALRPSLDSLRRQGYSLRLFAPGFRPVSAHAWNQPDSLRQLLTLARVADSATTVADDYWARARQAADSFPGRPLHLITGAALPYFIGARPALPARLTWQTVPLPDSAVWLAQAWQPHPDTLRLLVGRSQEEGTVFRTVALRHPRTAGRLSVAALPGLEYVPGPKPVLQLAGQPAVAIHTAPLRVVLYADAAHAAAGRYLRAALRAAALGLHRPLDLRTATPTAPLPNQTDWFFWLSDQPVPASWLLQARQGGNLWHEALKGSPVEARLALNGLADETAVAVRRLDTGVVARQTIIWQTGTGQPVLLRQPLGQGSRYQLRTRLQSDWTSLPESSVLPVLLLQLLRSESEPAVGITAHDLRQLDPRQLGALASVVAPVSSNPVTIQPAPQAVELRPGLLLAALLLFALERWLARRRSVSLSSSSL
ncbi:BatA domain-containing protein [Hymenobacter sediminicola]|uniref:BatA domain-containing protein n=1 Tax=Hymenobacter sediminicola TaxID=2761579 RepID=A0A7G7W6R6_9BACT|nr:BatA domain-containing protein [Hymenobacter sediminicola]QNH62059.1 BatA domain-containing protein [Hymenobacter sediminicola]